MLFVDADMLFLGNCEDDLFSLDAPALTFAFWSKASSDLRIQCPYGRDLNHGQTISHHIIEAIGFNSYVGRASLMLIEPNNHIFNDIIYTLKTNSPYGHEHCYSGFDEQLIADVYNRHGFNFTHIHPRFNYAAGKDDLYGHSPIVYHYYGDEKPWYYPKDFIIEKWPDTKIWWKYFDEILKAFPEIRRRYLF